MRTTTRLTLDELNKSNIWTITESELNQMLIEGKKLEDYSEFENHYKNIIRTVFDIQYLNRDDERKIRSLEAQHYEIFSSPNNGDNNAIAIRKHQLKKVTDLTLENIQHLEPFEVLKLIENNMGTGWKGLPLAIQDVIESAFFVDCSVLPTVTLHRAGGIVDRRKEDGYDVLELTRGTWTEAIFVKMKPKVEKVHQSFGLNSVKRGKGDDDDLSDDEYVEPEDEEEDEDIEEPSYDDEEIDEDEMPEDAPDDFEDIEVIDDIEEEDED